MKKLLLAALLSAVASPSFATTLTLDGGWQDDTVVDTSNPSLLSPWEFDLTGDAVFRLTDAFLVGDIYSIWLGDDWASAVLLGQSTYTTDGASVPDYAGVAWTNTNYSRFSYAFGPGSYSLWVTGDCGGTCPAGVGVRLDSAVPEPATWAMMLIGFGAIGFSIRRRRSAILQPA